MAQCRFVTFGNTSYTTANELGSYLIRSGVSFNSDANGCEHFGTVFNKALLTHLNKTASYSTSFPEITLFDFPKLVTKDENGNDIKHNFKFVELLLHNNMCETSSVAIMNQGNPGHGLDLYTVNAVKGLITQFGEPYGVKVKDSDFVFITRVESSPYLETTKRKDRRKETSQKQLFNVQH